MNPSGVLSVTETLVWRFGDDSGRHGIERYFIIREPYDDQQDAVYEIDNITVDSPDPGVATQFSERDDEAKDGREVQKRIRIGDPDETISAPTATYVISYEVKGAMRTFSGYDEFFWDATGFENPQIRQASVTAEVPGGAQDASCFAGPPQSTTTCDHVDFSPGGSATFSQANLAPGSGISIGVKITSGLVADNAPHLEPDGSKLTSGERAGADRPGRRFRRGPDRFAAGRGAVVAQERPGPALRRPRAGHRATGRAVRRNRGPRPGHSHPGGLHAAADPGSRSWPAGRRPGGHPGDGGDDHRPRRPRRAHRAEHRRGRLPDHAGRSRPGRGAARDGAADQPVRRRAAGSDEGPLGAGQHGLGPHQDARLGAQPGRLPGLVPQGPVGSHHRHVRVRGDRVRDLPGVLRRRVGAAGSWCHCCRSSSLWR